MAAAPQGQFWSLSPDERGRRRHGPRSPRGLGEVSGGGSAGCGQERWGFEKMGAQARETRAGPLWARVG